MDEIPADTLNVEQTGTAPALQAPWMGPPSPAHLEQITAARIRGVGIRRGVIVATLSAWTTAIFAGVTTLSGITSPLALLLGLGMGITAYFEFQGISRLKRLDRNAPSRMAINQLSFGAMLFLYGAISLWSHLQHPSTELAAQLAAEPSLAPMMGEIQSLERLVYILVYGTVMVVAVIGSGSTAIYYRSRIRHIDNYINQTPQWILELQRAGMNV